MNSTYAEPLDVQDCCSSFVIGVDDDYDDDDDDDDDVCYVLITVS